MTYIPIVPHVPEAPRPVSRETRELAEQIDDTIRDYLGKRGSLSPEEIRQALALAAAQHLPERASASGMVALGLVACLGLGVLALAMAGNGSPIMIGLVAGLAGVIGVAAFLARSR